MLLLALNEAFDRKTVDILLALDKKQMVDRVTGDGVINLASLISSGVIEIEEYYEQLGSGIGTTQFERWYRVRLSRKGKIFVDEWKKGDQVAAINLKEE